MKTIEDIKNKDAKIAVIGLGYVGLPLAYEFAKRGFSVVGFDISEKRISELRKGIDHTLESHEVAKIPELLQSAKLNLTTNEKDLQDCDFHIICTPTPVTEDYVPDMSLVTSAGEIVSKNVKDDAIVVLESTVYPGATEEILKPIVDKSGKKVYYGYSPERINPGDKNHTLSKVVKIVSGESTEILDRVAALYSQIIDAGVHRAQSIKVAEAAKAIENAQRDINIAYVNELAMIFDKMGISVWHVLDAAKTKWNFLDFKPGLVGGHCIPVDPYYLAQKAKSLGHNPQVILAGREINNNMVNHVSELVLRALNNTEKVPKNSSVLVMGATFKENVNDTRSSLTTKIIQKLRSYNVNVDVYDPLVKKEGIFNELPKKKYDGILATVIHDQFRNFDEKTFSELLKEKGFLVDLRGFWRNNNFRFEYITF